MHKITRWIMYDKIEKSLQVFIITLSKVQIQEPN